VGQGGHKGDSHGESTMDGVLKTLKLLALIDYAMKPGP
jgi:hypothetical protein